MFNASIYKQFKNRRARFLQIKSQNQLTYIEVNRYVLMKVDLDDERGVLGIFTSTFLIF